MDIQFQLAKSIPPADMRKSVADWAAGAALDVTMTGSLAKHPGSVHWHFKRGKRAGTLELTIVPATRHAWFSIKKGRACDWTKADVNLLAGSLQRLFGTPL